MSTPASGASAYASAADLVARYDLRSLGDLVADDGNRVASADLPANVNLLTALSDASGMIEAACTAGNRYEVNANQNDLAILTGNSLAFLKRLVCDLAVGLLYERRPDLGNPPQAYSGALALLEHLRGGGLVFGILEAQTAGEIAHQDESEQDVRNRFLTVTELSRMFGRRNNQQPWRPAS